ncbi:MAG: hypothetical protein C3F06_08680 [Candidatus Methanoperedenaceae archaeon]|nr:MAG: hypothetical protein C3F06_08680 [Candidatus Methanoperedenaceae archaeon]
MKDMKEIVTKLVNIEKKISNKKGSFNLFALFLREGNERQWDILVASKWIDRDKYKSLKYIASNIQKSLTEEELLGVSGIEIIDHNNLALDELYTIIKKDTEHSIVELSNFKFFGIMIQYAYIITSKKPGSLHYSSSIENVGVVNWVDASGNNIYPDQNINMT